MRNDQRKNILFRTEKKTRLELYLSIFRFLFRAHYCYLSDVKLNDSYFPNSVICRIQKSNAILRTRGDFL